MKNSNSKVKIPSPLYTYCFLNSLFSNARRKKKRKSILSKRKKEENRVSLFYFERNKSYPQSFDITSSSSCFNVYYFTLFIFRLFHSSSVIHDHKQLTNQLPELFIFPGNTNDFIIHIQDWRTPPR